MRYDIKWFFAWSGVAGYVTTECSWYRRDLIKEVERAHGRTWRKIYKQGGRAIKCKVTPISKGDE